MRSAGGEGLVFGASFHVRPCRLGQAVNPSRKILALEEDSQTINDGVHRWLLRGANVAHVRAGGAP